MIRRVSSLALARRLQRQLLLETVMRRRAQRPARQQQRLRRHRRQLRRRRLGLGHQRVILHHRPDHPPGQRRLGRHRLGQHRHPPRPRLARQVRQQERAAAIRHQPDAREGLQELRRTRRDHDVAAQRDRRPRARRHAVHRADRRHLQIGQRPRQRVPGLLDRRAEIPPLPLDRHHAAQIRPGAEPPPGAGQHHRPTPLGRLRRLQRRAQRQIGRPVQRVHLLRPVQPNHPIGPAILDHDSIAHRPPPPCVRPTIGGRVTNRQPRPIVAAKDPQGNVRAMPPDRPLYRYDQLDRLLNPAAIAIIGASPRPGAFGERVLANLADYRGAIHLVNARYDRIGDRPCHPSIAALPERIDCAVVTVARDAVHGVAEECIAAGAGGMIVFASGYAETALPERIALQQRLAARAREAGVPLIGPNCIGAVNHRLRSRITFMPYAAMPPPRPRAVGIISQSGALGFGMEQAMHHGTPISHVLTSGNSSDVDMADYVAFLADDPTCSVIALLFEGMSDPMRLMRACERARAARKPVIVCKLATGAHGAQAALSHTGSLAGSGAAYRAAFTRAGVIMVEDFEALMETASFFAKAPAPKATGVAVLATSGGAAIMAADKAERHGVPLPQPAPAAAAVLAARIPDFGSTRNPVDVTAQVMNDPESLPACADAMLDDPAYGALVIPMVFSGALSGSRVPYYNRLARRTGKPVINVWLTEWLEGNGATQMESDPSVVLFRSMDRCFATLAAWHRRAACLATPTPAPAGLIDPAARAQVAALLATATGTLSEREAKAALAPYGIPVVQESLTRSADEAAAVAARIGYPVVLKVESPDLPHKTEAGVIRLNLTGEADLRAAYAAVLDNAARHAPAARIAGVLVQPMVQAGVEIMIGARVDPQFGPLILVGLGGTMVELLQDTALALAPIGPAEAADLLDQLKFRAALDGFRGTPPVDRAALADIVARASVFIADHAARIAEIDINPLICTGARILAVDALIVTSA